MADEEQLYILKQGVEAWNAWRGTYVDNDVDPDLRVKLRYPDLSLADLRRADLCGANLSEANLRYSNLFQATLDQANLAGAGLGLAELSKAGSGRQTSPGPTSRVPI